MSVAMKDSGVDWLGQIPAEWSVAPLRVFLELRRDIVGAQSANTKLLSLTLQGVIERDLENPSGKMPASFDGYQRISAGEMVFCLFDMDETPRTVGVAPQNGMLTGAYTVFRLRSEIWTRYLYYFFLHVDEFKRLRPFYKGLRKTIRPGPFLSIQVPRPTADVARNIGDYLDSTAERIDTLVARKTRFLELLREKRQALITHAVNKGLDKNVRMHDCGAAWLGKVPETWDVAPLRVFLRLRRDIVGAASANTKLLSLTLQGIVERDLENPTGKMPASFDGYQRIDAGDMVFCLFDMDETPRTVGVAPQEGMLTGAYTVFRPRSELWARFLYYFFLHVDEYKRLRPFYKGLRKTIRPGPFLSIQVPRPSDEEARAIVLHLDHATARIDVLSAKTERSIELLREHRKALITAAVTGKIDLRQVA